MADDTLIDCSELDDFELEDFRRFAEADPAVDSLSLQMVKWTADPDGPIEIQASAEPLIFLVHLASAHKEAIASSLGTAALTDGRRIVSHLIKKWSEARANRYESKSIYGPDGEVAKIVKVRKPPVS